MQSFTGLLFEWPLIHRIRECADGAGPEKIGQEKM
jgi:hypothetical protein